MKGHTRSESTPTSSSGRPRVLGKQFLSSSSSSSSSSSVAEPNNSLHHQHQQQQQQQQQQQKQQKHSTVISSSQSLRRGVLSHLYGPGLTITRTPMSAPPPSTRERQSPTAPPLSSPYSPRSCRAQWRAAQAILDSKNQQLRANIQRLRAATLPGTDPGHVDASFDEYLSLRDTCMGMARALAGRDPEGMVAGVVSAVVGGSRNCGVETRSGASVGETIERLERMRIGSRDNRGDVDALSASFGGLEISDLSLNPRSAELPQTRRVLPPINRAHLATLHQYRSFISKLLQQHRTSLVETYQAYFSQPLSPETITLFLQNTQFRAEAIHKMRNSASWSSFKVCNTTPGYWPKYEQRCRDFDVLRSDLEEVERDLLRESEGGDKDEDEEEPEDGKERTIQVYTVAPRGDTILEFANYDGDSGDGGDSQNSALRFRVSSHMLAETSPYFARLFADERNVDPQAWDFDPLLPADSYRHQNHSVPSPRTVVLPGSKDTLKMYSMPSSSSSSYSSPNRHDALSILLHAAHMQTEKVPRSVTFPQFMAIAETCLRYECTSPLEVFVEHLWLPAWVHMAAERQDQGDGGGLLLISYVFGLRRLFTRMSKTAILNVVDREELWAKPWPIKLKERIWAVRNAKLAQVYGACAGAVQEYFQPPSMDIVPDISPAAPAPAPAPAPAAMGTRPFSQVTPKSSTSRYRATSISTNITAPGRHMSTVVSSSSNTDQPQTPSYTSLFSLSSTPRCPKGSHACDAANLGWLLLMFNELRLLQGSSLHISPPVSIPPMPALAASAPNHTRVQTPSRSLHQLLDVLRCIPPSPPPHVHSDTAGICDAATAVRAAVNDIYNSISGLTLYEVDGKRHGWALSKGKVGVPEVPFTSVSLGVLEIHDEDSKNVRALSTLETAPPPPLPDVSNMKIGFPMITEDGSDTVVSEEEGDEEENSSPASTMSYLLPTHTSPVPVPAPPLNEEICLRILSHLDTCEDLYAAARTNRAFYHTLKNNKRALTNHLVRAHRRLTLHVLTGEEKQGREKEGKETGPPSRYSTVGSSSTNSDFGSKSDGVDGVDAEGIVTSPERMEAGGLSPPPAAAAAAATRPISQMSMTITMTEEEAYRILWPETEESFFELSSDDDDDDYDDEDNNDDDDNENNCIKHAGTSEYTTTSTSSSNHDPTSAKYLADDDAMNVLRLVEDKTLVVMGDKSLREQLDRRIGIGVRDS